MRLARPLAVLSVAAALAVSGGVSSPAHAEAPTPEPPLSPLAYGVIEGARGAYELQQYALVVFVHAVHVDLALDYMVEIESARQRAAAAAAAAAQRASARTVVPSGGGGGGSCGTGGGNYQANPNGQYVQHESGGDYCASNPSGACGAYQIMPGTWQNFEGYASACDAPPAVQDRKAATMAPCNWIPPNYCA